MQERRTDKTNVQLKEDANHIRSSTKVESDINQVTKAENAREGKQSSTYEMDSSKEDKGNSHGEYSVSKERALIQYMRTPTALESALSKNSPLKMNLTLFDNYKVASQLPHDIYKTICRQSVTQPAVSAFQEDLS